MKIYIHLGVYIGKSYYLGIQISFKIIQYDIVYKENIHVKGLKSQMIKNKTRDGNLNQFKY